ncbi:MAG: DUF4097 family beta strand repeat-containing protein [Bacillota bacterium]
MDDERRFIEELRKSGRITEEEAAELLKALGEEDEQRATAAPGRTEDDGDWDLGSEISEAVREGIDEGMRGLKQGLEGMRYGLREGLGTGLREAMRGVREGLRAARLGGWWSGHNETVFLEHKVGAGARVTVIDPVGDVTIKAGAPGVVRVEADKSARGAEPNEAVARCSGISVRTEGDQESVTVRVDLGQASSSPRGSVDLEVEVPADSRVEVHGALGDITVTGPTSALDLTTDHGDIDVERAGGPVKAVSHRGDLTVHVPVPEARLTAEHGDVTARLRPSAGTSSEIMAGRGDVVLSLPADASVDLDLVSNDGDVTCDLPLSETKRRSERELVGRMGTGAARVKARTGGGDITVSD